MTDRDFANVSARARAPADDEAGLRTALRADDPGTRRDAALALVDRADDDGAALDGETVAALADRATSDDDGDVRQFAVETLGVARREPETLVAALSDPSEWVRAEAIVGLSRMGEGSDRVRELATDDDSGVVRRNAIIALAKRGGAEDDLLVDRLKRDPHPAVREYAAGFLPETDVAAERGVRLLAALLARDPSAFVRAKAARGLGRYGTDRAVTALEAHGLDDRSEDVTRAAERGLATARGEDPDAARGDRGGPPGGGPGGRRERIRDGCSSTGADGPPRAAGGPGTPRRGATDDRPADPRDDTRDGADHR